jgi:hypothetical protein
MLFFKIRSNAMSQTLQFFLQLVTHFYRWEM